MVGAFAQPFFSSERCLTAVPGFAILGGCNYKIFFFPKGL
ncbi:MAG: hypothetical protein ACI9I0_001916, partial [Rhodoferax sp.]